MSDQAPERSGARYWLTLAFIGVLGGLLSGAFGVGGGIIMVPLLAGIAGLNQREAASTSLIAIMPTALTGSIVYVLNGEVDLLAAVIVSIGAIVGAIIGSWLLRRLSVGVLRWLFVALLIVVAVRMLFVVPARGEEVEQSLGVVLGMLALGLVMGIASGLFGIGGGVLAVPVLIAVFGMGDLVAKGTSLLIMIPTSIFGSAMNLRGRTVSVRAGLLVGAAASVASIGGAALAFIIPPQLSGILFAVLVIAAAIQLTVKAIRAGR